MLIKAFYIQPYLSGSGDVIKVIITKMIKVGVGIFIFRGLGQVFYFGHTLSLQYLVDIQVKRRDISLNLQKSTLKINIWELSKYLKPIERRPNSREP